MRRIVLAKALLALLLCAAVYALYAFWSLDTRVMSFDDIRSAYKSSEAMLLDRHGEVIHELRVDYSGRRVQWKRLDDISPALIKAVVHSEDRRFYSHRGVDWIAILRASAGNVLSSRKSGASTITMQLASLIDRSLKGSGRRTVKLKLMQMRAALEFERTWSKDEVLEAYLNLVSFRGELQGISSASWGLFGKDTSGLNQVESAILASLIRSPNAPATEVERRAIALGASLGLAILSDEIHSMMPQLSGPYIARQKPSLAYHVAKRLLDNGQISQRSSIDGALQRLAAESLEKHIGSLTMQNVTEGAVLVVHNKTGEALAYVANRGERSLARYVDCITSKRQAGSTLKPFLYALAFERRLLTPASLVQDEPLNIPTARGMYSPDNYDNTYKGAVTVRTALASSLNVPAVKTAVLVGEDSFADKLRALSIKAVREGQYYGPSIALGSTDVTLWELVNAYRTLANHGVRSDMTLLLEGHEPAGRRVFSKEASFLVSDILSDREARSLTFGFENVLSTKYWSAVKTGTSKDMRDNWCIGYTRDYTVGVWVGNMNNAPMWDVSGTSGAAPVWLEVMDYLHRERKSPPPTPSSNVVMKAVTLPDGSTKDEWFIKGTEPLGNILVANNNDSAAKIIYPVSGTRLAIDPDIPQEAQRVFMESSGDNNDKWILNGSEIAKGKFAIWEPVEGKYELVLADEQGSVLDSVSFEVR